jgi:hydroxymethylbilane synthase
MSRILRIGTRGSRLALAQTRAVVGALERAAPGTGFDVVVIKTQGDRSGETGTPGLPGVGVFVREIERALVEGEIDLAVHSLKDVPTETALGTVIAAVPERADPRDVLVSREGLALDRLAPGSRVGTSSARRRAQILRARPDLEAVPIRGNVDTRLRKVAEGENGLSAIVLAAAGLARLGLIDRATEHLPVDRFPPSAGQGAIAVQVRADDVETCELAGCLDHAESRTACEAERSFIATLGAGCRTPVGAYAAADDGAVKITGAVYSEDGTDEIRGEDSGPAGQAAETGARLARRLGARGAFDLVSRAKEQIG